jgi:GT2 family glycosyltransferase
LLVFLNDDVVVTDRWVEFLRSDLADAQVGCASGVALFLDNRSTINSAGGLCDILGFGQNRAIGESVERVRERDWPRPFYAVGTVFATRKSVWEATGGFDETMFMYADDLDWSWRVRLRGYRITLDERVVVYHKWHGSGLGFGRMVYYLERNEIRAFLKNHGAATLIWILPILVSVKLAKLLAFAFVDRRLLRATLEAWLWNLIHLRSTFHLRSAVQRGRRVPDRAIIRDMVIGSLEMSVALRRIRHPLRAMVGRRQV